MKTKTVTPEITTAKALDFIGTAIMESFATRDEYSVSGALHRIAAALETIAEKMEDKG